MSDRGLLALGIIMGIMVLAIAFKWGEIGGGGAGANRDKNPINFWLGVCITALFTAVAIVFLISTFI
jgi:hypothetical protein